MLNSIEVSGKTEDEAIAWALARTSSTVPTLKNALSGQSSSSPSRIARKPRIVSVSGT